MLTKIGNIYDMEHLETEALIKFILKKVPFFKVIGSSEFYKW